MIKTVIKYIILTVIGIVLFYFAHQAASVSRGGFAIGGEILLAFLPLWWWLVGRILEDWLYWR